MSVLRSRWRSVTFCATALLSLLGLLAGPASASQTIDVEHRTAITLDSDAHWWQQGAPDHYKVVSNGAYQYTAYWDATDGSGNSYLKIARRRVSDNNLQTITFNNASGRLADPLDPHDTAVLGVSPIDGRLHVEWADHSGPMHYAISSTGCLTQATFSSCTFTWQHQTASTRQEENVTYPMFINNRAGDLYCGFREGSGSDGSWVWHGYNNNGTWSDLGNILNGHTGSGSYDVDGAAGLELGWNPATRRGPYVDAVQFDHNDRLHLMWTWRETVPNVLINPFQAQHDIYYAYSDDYGLTWKDNSGTTIGTHNSDPIVIGDAGSRVVSVPLGYQRVNDARMVIDRDNQPHMIVPTSDTYNLDPQQARLRAKHYWRTTDGAWHEQFVEPSEDAEQEVSIGDLIFNRANDAYYVYPRNNIGWFPWNDDDHNTTYNEDFPADHFTIQEGAYLVAEPISQPAFIDTTVYVGTPIATGSASNNRDIVIRIKNTTDATDARFNFITDADQTWDFHKIKAFTDPNDGAFHTITVPMTSLGAYWSGTLHSLELEGAESATPGSGSFTIDYIRIENDSGTIARQWEFNNSVELKAAEASGAEGWNNWEIYNIAPGANLSWYDAISFDIDAKRYDGGLRLDFPVLEQGAPGTESEKIYEYPFTIDNVDKVWGFSTDLIGWTVLNQVSGLTWVSDSGAGAMQGRLAGNDSSVMSANDLHAPIETSRTVQIRMKNSTASGQTMSLCWAVDGGQRFEERRCVQGIRVTADGAYHTYNIETSAFATWGGHELTRLRIDPSDGEAITTGTFTIDSVKLLD